MIVKVVLLLTIILKTSRCSLIIDNDYQNGLYLSDYCPNMKYCREGTHVMCMYYDPKNEIGPRCNNAVNISITADLARYLLEVFNSIRSKIANGKETGKGGKLLPRGYGVFRLKWDSELATFAQVLANQCVLRHDLCRATQRFSNPSQLIGRVRFTFPDWQIKNQVEKIGSPKGVTNAKLMHAITQSLKSWYGFKSAVTEQMIKAYPDWNEPQHNKGARLYLEMIHGSTTHLGCGISGYSEYVYTALWQGVQNTVEVICNLSSEPRMGTSTYETKSPIPGQGFSLKCGCPPGSNEDNDCLCNEVPPPPRSRPEPTCPVSERSGNNCDPTLVLLPIFTMEDAPPDKLYKIAEEIKDPLKDFILQRIDNTSDNIEREGSFRLQRARPSAEIFDIMHAKEGEDVVWQRARNPSLPQLPATSYNKIENTSDTIERQGSIKQERARSSSSAEMFDFINAKEGGESFIEKDILWQRARNPSPPQSPAPSYNKFDNTSDNTIEKQDFFKHVRARSSKELFDFLHAKERAGVLWQRGRNPFSPQAPASSYNNIDNTSDTIERQGSIKQERARSLPDMFDFINANDDNLWHRDRNPFSPQSPAPTFKNLHREKQAAPVFRFGPASKPPPPPPRKSPTLRPSLPARPLRTRPPPPPPPPPPRKPPPPPPAIHELTSTQKAPRPAASAAVRLQDRRKRPVPKLPPTHRLKSKKGSIFTKVAQFQLPKRRSLPAPSKVIKKDVAPRKDFSNLSKVVHDYLKSRPGYKIFSDNHEQNKTKEESKPTTEERSQTEAVITDSGLHNAEETVINFNEYLSPQNNSNYNDKDVDIKDDNDNKLLTLLDTLEQEVKHIALDGSEKELFDAKIRKIYGSIVGKTALLKFPKPILLSNADTEAPEIDFGGTKASEMLEPDNDEDNHVTTEEPKQRSRYKVDQRIGRVKNYNPSIQGHKWKNKFIDSFDQKSYRDNTDVFSYGDGKPPSDSFDHKFKGNFDHEYGDIDHKHMDELDRKYNEDINKKYSENHLDHEYKLSDNFHHQHNYDLKKKYDDNVPASRSKIKYEADRAVFREFGHNSLDTQEDPTLENYKYKDKKANHVTPEIPVIAKDREKRKKTERKHRKRIKSLNKHNGHNDPLSLERRKYYQDKLDNIRKKLRGRKNRSKNDSKNERSLRRMHTKNRESSRPRSKSPANNFYMPERAKFLHGF